MQNYDIYKDVEKRTGGEIFIGVVGPVRTGKSTFVSKFIEKVVLPNVVGKNKRAIATDEMPQSGTGKSIMTTEPKFVPSEAVTVKISGGGRAKIRLIDCIGYIVKGAIGFEEDGAPRMVKTPWSENPVTFKEAGETGTTKVIREHSTIGIVVTTDGSFTDIPREGYAEQEERVIKELKQIGKPFCVLLNVKDEKAESAINLGASLQKKYGVSVVVKNCENLSESDIDEILSNVLLEFPVRTASIKTPEWVKLLDADNRVIGALLSSVREKLPLVKRMRDSVYLENCLQDNPFVESVQSTLYLGEGKILVDLTLREGLFFEELSLLSGESIASEKQLYKYVLELCVAKRGYEKLKGALQQAESTGYGIATPLEDEIILSEPEMVKTGSSYGVKIKATAPSLHIVKVEIGAEVNSVVGKELQCQSYVDSLKKQYQENPQGIMQVDLFGRPIYSFVSEEIFDKAGGMKEAFREKIKKTVSKLVNEKKSALFCVTI